MVCRVILDTNILVSACLGSGPANQVVRACLLGLCRPLIGVALFAEYEDVMGRGDLCVRSPLTAQERQHLFDIFLGHCEWTRVYFGWRPNLPDEADNHLIELALAGGASFIVSRKLRDLVRGELQFPGLRALDPASFLEELSRWPH